ncbi:3-deoxy-D-manno-octulosonate cytidylyltransferase [Notoacmeibacter marinus]|uniref:3-deoxy-manno-octulosonate cytidylyltransferase n=1 Tax=Notoacmeibacter marinus TaxID=1876515 RepID=A0A231UT92_9HYPH|nr:3-deoxy-manno-octulosonate cytidylyltransferase [Notoacmeibacter marinus]OXS99167.1 3-deoxy-D-manno-octulosonate cytidylyltransferase [Notoacmeibacter marinus]
MPNVAAIIPCRYGATRFPGKPLADINGKPMMWHVFQRACETQLVGRAYIATDDDRIARQCEILDLPVIRTRSSHPTGTDRIAEAIRATDEDVIVNVQGDEPMIDPAAIDAVVQALIDSPDEVLVTNGCHVITHSGDAIDTNNVKVVCDFQSNALAYSRLPIPYPKGDAVRHLRQLGLYAFRRDALKLFSSLRPGPLERAESVEMLRFVEHGHKVKMVEVAPGDDIPVDTPSDLERVRAKMSGQKVQGPT